MLFNVKVRFKFLLIKENCFFFIKYFLIYSVNLRFIIHLKWLVCEAKLN